MVSKQGIESVKFTNKAGVELPNIKDRCGTKYTDVQDDQDNYNNDYVELQCVNKEIQLHVEEEIDKKKVKALLVDEGQGQ